MADATSKGELKDSLVIFRAAQNGEVRGAILKLSRFSAIFELYNPDVVLRLSAVLEDFKIVATGRTIYAGRAVVRNVMDTGSAVMVCEVTLSEDCWTDVSLLAAGGQMTRRLADDYNQFMSEWQKLYRVRPEYKVVLADMQTYFTDLRLWLEQLEMGVRMTQNGKAAAAERQVAIDLEKSIIATITALFERFEDAAKDIDESARSAHEILARRQLHPLLLCAPFLNRCFTKPLGYAGDYEMVNMMLRNPLEGGSLFAKVVNFWFVRQAPAEAHRNRIDYLYQHIGLTALRVIHEKRAAQVISIGCGPAQEIQRYLAEHRLNECVVVSLLDFNEETLAYTRRLMDEIKARYELETPIHYIKKSVHTLLKENSRRVESPSEKKYDLVYCAGLFDYLSDQVCQHLMDLMYDWVAPGGMLIATNVDACNPRKLTMDYIMAWHLIYRNSAQMLALKPAAASKDDCVVRSDSTGVNVYIEVKKPDHA